MLTVAANKTMQELSNQTLNALANLRNKQACIPAWAAQDQERRILFEQYGSPNVLGYFNPHLSIFSADHLQENKTLYQQLQKLIEQFAQSHLTQRQETVSTLGVGIANDQGQIVE